MAEKEDTCQLILDVSQYLLQTRGYNGFSYADIAKAVGIRKASIHYYFPNKSDLGEALVKRYRESFRQLRARIDRETDDALSKLKRFVEPYLEGLLDGRVCLCGMLAEEFTTLPKQICVEIKSFLDENEAWLTKVLMAGREAGIISYQGPVEVEAQLLLIGLHGAQSSARFYGDTKRFELMAHRLLSGFAVKA